MVIRCQARTSHAWTDVLRSHTYTHMHHVPHPRVTKHRYVKIFETQRSSRDCPAYKYHTGSWCTEDLRLRNEHQVLASTLTACLPACLLACLHRRTDTVIGPVDVILTLLISLALLLSLSLFLLLSLLLVVVVVTSSSITCMCVYIYIYIHTHTCTYMHIYIYICV